MASIATAQKISPMIWLDNQAEEAADFYTSAFPNSRMGRIARYVEEGKEIHGGEPGSVMTVDFELDGQRFSALNGGPLFRINPAISFFAALEDERLVEAVWKRLSEGGQVLMALQKHPWSPKYGWVQDRFGVSWQIALGPKEDIGGRRFGTSLTFAKERCGQAEAAMNHYASVFKDAKITGVLRNGLGDAPEKEGTVKHAQFTLAGQTFMVMDSAGPHDFTFNEAISLVVTCEDQDEVDYYWDRLSAGGDPQAQVCGWLKDRFGVSWQVVPAVMEEMLQDPDKAKIGRLTKAFMGMKKFDIAALERAFAGS